jgi:hypothetical protein
LKDWNGCLRITVSTIDKINIHWLSFSPLPSGTEMLRVVGTPDIWIKFTLDTNWIRNIWWITTSINLDSKQSWNFWIKRFVLLSITFTNHIWIRFPIDMNWIGSILSITASINFHSRNVEILGSSWFSFCGLRSSITFESNSRLTRIESEVFYKSSFQSILIPGNVEILGSSCFSNCESLSSITVDSNSQLTRIESFAFYITSLQWILIPNNAEILESKNFSSGESLSPITFESNSHLTRTKSWMFSFSSIQSILIPRNVQILGWKCFSCCLTFPSITFESHSQLTGIAWEAFSFSSLQSMWSLEQHVCRIWCNWNRFTNLSCWSWFLSGVWSTARTEKIGYSSWFSANSEGEFWPSVLKTLRIWYFNIWRRINHWRIRWKSRSNIGCTDSLADDS